MDPESQPEPPVPLTIESSERICTPTVLSPVEAERGDGNSSPRVFVSLRTPEKDLSFKKTSVFSSNFIVESLQERQTLTESKLCNLRMNHKAKEMEKIRPFPEINPKSKKIILKKNKNLSKEVSSNNYGFSSPQNRKEKTEPLLFEYFKRNSSLNNEKKRAKKEKNEEEKIKPRKEKFESILNAPLSPTAFKGTPKNTEIKEELKRPSEKNDDVIERNKNWKEKIDKKNEEKRKIKSIQELEECTFKPKLSPKGEFNDTGSMITKEYSMRSTLKSQQFGKSIKKYVTDVEALDCNYKQISPVEFTIKHELGFNFQVFINKAQPMANYQFVEGEF